MRLAVKFGTPLITLIDTAGPATTLDAEEEGIGHCIASTMSLMGSLPVPTVAVVIGEGGREGALALSIADRVLMLESAVLSPISPEAAAGLMFRDDTRAEDAARSMRITAADALELKIIDAFVPEPPGGPQEDPDEAARLLRRALVRALAQLQAAPPNRLLRRRHKKFRNMGEYTPYFYAVLAREVETLQGYVVGQVKEVRTRRRRRQRDGAKPPTPAATQEEPSAPDTAADLPPLETPSGAEPPSGHRTGA
jgi:enoyl-CoA hydratase/carnithine racemase